MSSPGPPVLSVVVVIVSDTTGPAHTRHLTACLEAFSEQVGTAAVDVELVVPHTMDVDGIDELHTRFPHVFFVPVDGLTRGASGAREHHDVLRARGLLAARGDILTLIEDHARPAETYCANVIAAHAGGASAIGGAIENGLDRPLSWAVYFCDFGRYQNPVPRGASLFASDANVSYRRSTLFSIREIWEESFREVVVNGALRSRGGEIVLQPDIVVYQHRTDLRLLSALTERFIWGRSYAGTRNAHLSFPNRLLHAFTTPALPLVLLARTGSTAWERRRCLRA